MSGDCDGEATSYITLLMDREICCANSSESIALHEILTSPNDFVKLQFPTLNKEQMIIGRCMQLWGDSLGRCPREFSYRIPRKVGLSAFLLSAHLQNGASSHTSFPEDTGHHFSALPPPPSGSTHRSGMTTENSCLVHT